jgi:hypothetical protein
MHLRNYLDGSDKTAFDMEEIGHREDCDHLWQAFQELNP